MNDLEHRVTEARTLSMLLFQAMERARNDFGALAARHGVTPPMARVLLLLAEPVPMRGVARELGVDPSYVTGVADELERAGLVERTVGLDRRVKLLRATARGAEVRARLAESISREATVLTRLTEDERATLRLLAQRLLAEATDPVAG
ncbi:MAG: MarR family transcriptional regulator [Propionicimonas sp.]|nr:MarR family transcriptional regulator [Propionicimonas sp.]MEA5117360.1 MarR family transcriptional regulator [Propionicimonas sp.]